jgi:hydrogenase nickel incorporation protein HypA/HybF
VRPKDKVVHEISVAERMVAIAVAVANENGGGRITGMRLLIGALTCVDSETLEFAFGVVTRGTAADGCRLEIVRVPTRLSCLTCGIEAERDLLEPCGTCGSVGGDVLAGRELRVDAIDLDEGPPGDSPAPSTETSRSTT